MKRYLLIGTALFLGVSNCYAAQIQKTVDTLEVLQVRDDCVSGDCGGGGTVVVVPEIDPVVPEIDPVVPEIDPVDLPTLDKGDIELVPFDDETSVTVSEEARAMCESLGYTVTKKSLCNNKAFPCPRGGMWKCDETAKVGDIKYSSSSSSANGWLVANGSTYDKDKYPELYSLIGTNFGGTASSPKLPNYTGTFLRAAGTVSVTRTDGTKHTLGKDFSATNYKTMQSSTLRKHTHQNYYWYVSTLMGDNGGYGHRTDFYTQGDATVTFGSSGSGSYVCPKRVNLTPMIYAGQPAK